MESTENTHSTFPTASSLTCTWSKILSQVPSAVHNRNRSCAVFHGPYWAGTSRHGRADVYLPQGQRATGQWDDANTAAVAGAIAHRFGLDDEERSRGVFVEAAAAIEQNDPRWIVTFAL